MAGSEALEADVERVQAGAHELVEMRLRNALRTGEVALPGVQADEAARLLGAEGPAVATRLGLDLSAGDDAVRAALAEAFGRWQRRAENPIAIGVGVEAARVLVRTCEALAAATPAAARRTPGPTSVE